VDYGQLLLVHIFRRSVQLLLRQVQTQAQVDLLIGLHFSHSVEQVAHRLTPSQVAQVVTVATVLAAEVVVLERQVVVVGTEDRVSLLSLQRNVI
jgi:hypothetical protein